MKRLAFIFSIVLVAGLIASPASALTIVVRAQGTDGSEIINLTVNSSVIGSWRLTTSMDDYTANTVLSGICTVEFTNDADGRDVQVDYITVDGTTLQAEDQEINTGVWENGSCGGSYSEWMHCSGYIDFGCVGTCSNLSVSPTSLGLAPEANSTGTFDITSDTTWTVSSNRSWLTPDPTAGANDVTVTLTAQANISTSRRIATVTVSGENVASKTVKVTQEAILFILQRWFIIAADANSTRTIDFTSSRSWTVSSDQTWLTVSPESGSGDGTLTVTAQENTTPSTRTAIVTINVPEASQTVTVVQMYDGDGECVIPPMPPFSFLWNIPTFPDPFTFMDGHRMTTIDEWTCRRAEIATLVQEFELGYMQETPYSATTGSWDGNDLTVTVNDNGEVISFSCPITYPSTGSPPYPAMIGLFYSFLNDTELSNLGVAVINFPTDEIAEQVDTSSRGIGKFYDMYGSGHSAGALMAWAWGVDRLIDALEKTPEANIDPTRLGVTGCSRWGKGALVAGAFCERIKLTIPQESGAGGAASWRVSQYQKDTLGQNVQTLSQIVTENCWFRSDFSQFSNVKKLPLDQHMVAALCLPNALLFIENTSMEWLGNLSTWTNGNVTHKVWEAFGIPDKMGFSQVGHGDHCVFPSSQQPEVTAYVQKFLVVGGIADTNIMETDGGFIFDETTWVDWTVPDLKLLGDFVNPYGVNFIDFAVFANHWRTERLWWDLVPAEGDGVVNFLDWAVFANNWDGSMFQLSYFVSQWLISGVYADIAPVPDGDGVVNMLDLQVLTENWLEGLQ